MKKKKKILSLQKPFQTCELINKYIVMGWFRINSNIQIVIYNISAGSCRLRTRGQDENKQSFVSLHLGRVCNRRLSTHVPYIIFYNKCDYIKYILCKIKNYMLFWIFSSITMSVTIKMHSKHVATRFNAVSSSCVDSSTVAVYHFPHR